MKALIVSLEQFQKGDIPLEVKKFIVANKGNIFTVLDESSKIKTNEPCKESKKSKRTQAVLKLNQFGQRCILTGTFMSKSPVNAYDQMNFLKPNFFPESMYAFASKYTIRTNLVGHRGVKVTISQSDYKTVRKRLLRAKENNRYEDAVISTCNFYGITKDDCEHILENEEYSPFKHLDELEERIGDTCMKVDRRDVFDLPERVYKTVSLELTSEQKKLYKDLQQFYCTDHITVDNGLGLYLRFQDICNGYEPMKDETEDKVDLVPLKANPKIEALLEVLEDIGNEQVVVWCSRTKLLHDACGACRKQGYACGIYDGKVDKADREADYNAFSVGKLQILFANQASAGFGLDKLKNAFYAVYLCNSYSVEQREQSESRIDRGIYNRSKIIIDITFKGTCEDRVTVALKQGKELLNKGSMPCDFFKLDENEEIIF